MGALLAGIALGRIIGEWIGLLVATLATILLFWLWSPKSLDKAPRSLSGQEMQNLTEILRSRGKDLTEKKINLVKGYDPGFSSKLHTIFTAAGWSVWTGKYMAGWGDLGDLKGIHVRGRHRSFVKAAFDAIPIAVKVSEIDPDDETHIICCN